MSIWADWGNFPRCLCALARVPNGVLVRRLSEER